MRDHLPCVLAWGPLLVCMVGRSHLSWQQRQALHGVDAVMFAPQQARDLLPGAQGDPCLRWLLCSTCPQLGAGALPCCTLFQMYLQCRMGAPVRHAFQLNTDL